MLCFCCVCSLYILQDLYLLKCSVFSFCRHACLHFLLIVFYLAIAIVFRVCGACMFSLLCDMSLFLDSFCLSAFMCSLVFRNYYVSQLRGLSPVHMFAWRRAPKTLSYTMSGLKHTCIQSHMLATIARIFGALTLCKHNNIV